MIALTYSEVLALDPCPEGLAKAVDFLKWTDDRKITVREAIEAGVDLNDVLLVLGRLTDPDVNRRLRLFAADCSARVLPLYKTKPSGGVRKRKKIELLRGQARLPREELPVGGAHWIAVSWASTAALEAARASWDAERAWQRQRLIERMEGEPEDWPLGGSDD